MLWSHSRCVSFSDAVVTALKGKGKRIVWQSMVLTVMNTFQDWHDYQHSDGLLYQHRPDHNGDQHRIFGCCELGSQNAVKKVYWCYGLSKKYITMPNNFVFVGIYLSSSKRKIKFSRSSSSNYSYTLNPKFIIALFYQHSTDDVHCAKRQRLSHCPYMTCLWTARILQELRRNP